MLVVADGSQTSWHDTDRIALDTNVDWIGLDLSFQPFGPVGVTDSWGTEGNDLDLVEQLQMVDVDITDHRQSTTEGNTSDDEVLSVRTSDQVFVDLFSD